jgi:hypothetical protein
VRRGKGAGEGRRGDLSLRTVGRWRLVREESENVRKGREAINRAVTRSEPAAESLQIAG